jgi:hypothetical protein
MKIALLLDDALSTPVEADWHFRVAYCLHHQGGVHFWNSLQFTPDYTAPPPRKHLHTRRRENIKSYHNEMIILK